LPGSPPAAIIFIGKLGFATAIVDMREKPRHTTALAAACLGVLIAWGTRLLMASALGDRLPFITFFPMIFVLAWWGGFWPTFYASIFSAAVLAYAILEPVGSFAISLPEYRLGLLIFEVIAIAIGLMGETFHSAKRDRQRVMEFATKEGERLRRTIAERKHAEESLTFLAHASTHLAALADRHSALQQAARLPVPFLADWCVVYVIDEHGAIDYHAHAHRDPAKDLLLGEMLSKFPLDWDSNTATVRALRTGTSQLMEELPEPLLSSFTQSNEHRDIVRELGPRAVISVPLKIRERTIGVIGLVSCDPERKYTHREVELAESLALRVAVAVDNARLFHAVKEASRQKDDFLAMLAHELRNPLAAIRYAVAIGQMGGANGNNETFEVIDRQTQNLAHLIEDLLDVSRISRDKITLRKETIDIATIINGAAATARPLIQDKNHQLIIELPGEPVYVFADPTRAEQIVANLLTNAAKYTKNGGTVTVRACSDRDEAVIQVVDTGIGLPPELLTRVFDLFAQADRTLDRSEGGLGIGLTVARKLAEMHGGTIMADSAGLGTGSTFTVKLPLSHQLPTKDRPAVELNKAPIPCQRVLVVDDNRDTATSCATLLRGMGHEVEIAYDGLAAVEAAHKFKPQTIFLDIGLPGMNGYEVAKTLRDEGLTNELIVAVSGYGQPEDRERSHNAGFDEHLVKPVDQHALMRVLRDCADKQPIAT
jgi:signal transduction histidine kinase/ActR/RegA family two-component response regulator